MKAELYLPTENKGLRLAQSDLTVQHVYHIAFRPNEVDIFRLGAQGTDFVSRTYKSHLTRFSRKDLRLTESDYRELYNMNFENVDLQRLSEINEDLNVKFSNSEEAVVEVPLPNPVSRRTLEFYNAEIRIRDAAQRLPRWNKYNKDMMFFYAEEVKPRNLRAVLKFS